MRKVKTLLVIAIAGSLFFAMSACSKTGPAGATGATGPAGPAGPTGATGLKGDTGVANVIYSPWTDVTLGYRSSKPGDTTWIGTMAAPKLDSLMLLRGEIKVYINLNTAAVPSIAPLPYFDGGTIINTQFEKGTIYIVSTDNVSTVTQGGVKYLQYRYILIPGGKAARGVIDWNDYGQVKNYLHLTD